MSSSNPTAVIISTSSDPLSSELDCQSLKQVIDSDYYLFSICYLRTIINQYLAREVAGDFGSLKIASLLHLLLSIILRLYRLLTTRRITNRASVFRCNELSVIHFILI
jgi:hypothetical protein